MDRRIVARKSITHKGVQNKPITRGSVVKYFTTFQNTIADVLSQRGWRKY